MSKLYLISVDYNTADGDDGHEIFRMYGDSKADIEDLVYKKFQKIDSDVTSLLVVPDADPIVHADLKNVKFGGSSTTENEDDDEDENSDDDSEDEDEEEEETYCDTCDGENMESGGWVHEDEPLKHVALCSDCNRFATDAAAIDAHEEECGCYEYGECDDCDSKGWIHEKEANEWGTGPHIEYCGNCNRLQESDDPDKTAREQHAKDCGCDKFNSPGCSDCESAGWRHIYASQGGRIADGTNHIEKCDDCTICATDEDAQKKHDLKSECGCKDFRLCVKCKNAGYIEVGSDDHVKRGHVHHCTTCNALSGFIKAYEQHLDKCACSAHTSNPRDWNSSSEQRT